MKLSEFIQEQIFWPRLREKQVLAVYDPDGRYRDMCLEMASETLAVIDVGESGILAREQALKTLQAIGACQAECMMIYIPAPPPVTDEEKIADPFSLYAVCGAAFPEGPGDAFEQICLKAKSDFVGEIRRIFNENPDPSFAVIDAVGGGRGWPNLRAAMGVESAAEILLALLAPSGAQKKALLETAGWVSEAKDLFSETLGLKLRTKGKTWSPVADELWRFVLFSEFALDLPEDLPEALANVPKAFTEARPLVEDLCERLRKDLRTQSVYIEQAARIEAELQLPDICRNIRDFGHIDTFPFEERFFLTRGIDALQRDNPDVLREILTRQTDTVWTGVGESQAQWGLVGAVAALRQACDEAETQLPAHAGGLNDLVDFFTQWFRLVDQRHREFETGVADLMGETEILNDLIESTRRRYRRLVDKLHPLFLREVGKTGWPPLGGLSNADVFDSILAPKLRESGRRIAFLMVDSLRYELAVALEKELSDLYPVELVPAFAPIPTITSVGMAALLPEAGRKLRLEASEDGLVPVLDGKPIKTVAQRMDVFRSKYGQRFQEKRLDEFVKARKSVPETVELLVLRSVEIDSQMETSPEVALTHLLNALKRIRVAINKLKSQGFHEVVIAADHGFCLNGHAEAGDVAAKPPGNWCFIHDRIGVGDGAENDANFVFSAAHLGIQGSFDRICGPRSLIPYRAGVHYFHGGLSLQEGIVPVLTIRLGKETRDLESPPSLSLSYKSGGKKVATRVPVMTLAYESSQQSLFPDVNAMEILLEAHDAKGEVIGEAMGTGSVNPATRTVEIRPGETLKVTLRMQMEFEGKFTVKAMNPTTFATYATLSLETDYMV